MSKRARAGCQTKYYYVGALVDERYRLTDFIGSGGMACVYRAQEEGSPHHYAVKFLKTEFYGEDYLVEYFRDEAGSMRDLAHPNIVRFYRFVNKPEYSYILMDYIDGFALSDVLKKVYRQKRELPLDEIVRIMTQIARALDAIHREGYVHRDIKPSNVLIERSTGQTFLTDLGITTPANTRMEGAGTLAYLPPELSETWAADHYADIYSFATMYFELLAGRRPFIVKRGLKGQEAEFDLIRKHKQAPVPDLTAFRPDLPEALNDIMRQALAKKPYERHKNIIDFAREVHETLKPMLAEDLQDFASISHRQIAAPEAITGRQETPPSRALMWGMVVVGALAILMVGILTMTLLNVSPFGTPEPSNTPTPTATYTPTPNPLTGLPVLDDFLSGVAALAEPTDSEDLIITKTEVDTLQYLRVGRDVDGFSVTLDIAEHENVAAYGLAFRLQDEDNYLLFTVDDSGAWTFSEVIDGINLPVATGTLNTMPNTLSVSGYADFYQVTADDETINLESDAFATGSLALYLDGDGASLTLNELSIALLGDDAERAAVATPTPAASLADPYRFLRADIAALLQTNDIANSAINCPPYIDVYETLDRHLDSPHSDVRQLAQEAIDFGEVVYARCRSESPDDALAFVTAIQDYLEWEENLRSIQSELGG